MVLYLTLKDLQNLMANEKMGRWLTTRLRSGAMKSPKAKSERLARRHPTRYLDSLHLSKKLINPNEKSKHILNFAKAFHSNKV